PEPVATTASKSSIFASLSSEPEVGATTEAKAAKVVTLSPEPVVTIPAISAIVATLPSEPEVGVTTAAKSGIVSTTKTYPDLLSNTAAVEFSKYVSSLVSGTSNVIKALPSEINTEMETTLISTRSTTEPLALVEGVLELTSDATQTVPFSLASVNNIASTSPDTNTVIPTTGCSIVATLNKTNVTSEAPPITNTSISNLKKSQNVFQQQIGYVLRKLDRHSRETFQYLFKYLKVKVCAKCQKQFKFSTLLHNYSRKIDKNYKMYCTVCMEGGIHNKTATSLVLHCCKRQQWLCLYCNYCADSITIYNKHRRSESHWKRFKEVLRELHPSNTLNQEKQKLWLRKKEIPVVNLEDEKNDLEDLNIIDEIINDPTSQKCQGVQEHNQENTQNQQLRQLSLRQENQHHNEEEQLGQQQNFQDITSSQVTELSTQTCVISSLGSHSQATDRQLCNTSQVQRSQISPNYSIPPRTSLRSISSQIPSQSVHMQQAHEHSVEKYLLSQTEQRQQSHSESSSQEQLLSTTAISEHLSVHQKFSQTVQIQQLHSKSSIQEQTFTESVVPLQSSFQMTELSQLHSQSSIRQQDKSLETLNEKSSRQAQEPSTNQTASQQYKSQALPYKHIKMHPQQYISHSQTQLNPSQSIMLEQPPTQLAVTHLSPMSTHTQLLTQSEIQLQSPLYPTTQINPHLQPPTNQNQPPIQKTTNQPQTILQQQRTQIQPHFQPTNNQIQSPLQTTSYQQFPTAQPNVLKNSHPQLAMHAGIHQIKKQFDSPTFPPQTYAYQNDISSQPNIAMQIPFQRQLNHHQSLIRKGTAQPPYISKHLPPQRFPTQYPILQSCAVLPPQWQSATLYQSGPQPSLPQQPSPQPSPLPSQPDSHQHLESSQPNITYQNPSQRHLNPQQPSIQQMNTQPTVIFKHFPPHSSHPNPPLSQPSTVLDSQCQFTPLHQPGTQLPPPQYPSSQPSTFPQQHPAYQHPLISQPNITINCPLQRHTNPIPLSKQPGDTQSTVHRPPQKSPQHIPSQTQRQSTLEVSTIVEGSGERKEQKQQECQLLKLKESPNIIDQYTQTPQIQNKSNLQQDQNCQIQQHPQMMQLQHQVIPHYHQQRYDQSQTPRHPLPTYQRTMELTTNHCLQHQNHQQHLKQQPNLQQLQIQHQHEILTPKELRVSASYQQQKQIRENAEEWLHQKQIQNYNTSCRAKIAFKDQEIQQTHREALDALSVRQADHTQLESTPHTFRVSKTQNSPAQASLEQTEVNPYSDTFSQNSNEELLEHPHPPSTPLSPLPHRHYSDTPTLTPFTLTLPIPTPHSPVPPKLTPLTPMPIKPSTYTSAPHIPATHIHAPPSPTNITVPDIEPSTPAPKIVVAELFAPLQDSEAETFNIVCASKESKDEIEICNSQWKYNMRIEETFNDEETTALNISLQNNIKSLNKQSKIYSKEEKNKLITRYEIENSISNS
ncbi:unnamed protein product, partial [Meganyctiphanes norvegica]